MNKINYLTFSGISMALAGVFILSSEIIGVSTAKILIPLMFIIGGILACMFSGANPQHKIAKQYHMLHGISMIVFALIIGFGAQNLSAFLNYITYFMLFFGMIEFIFPFVILNSSQKINIGILISRVISGFLNMIGAIIILSTSIVNEINSLMIAGVFILIGGIGFIIFSFRIKSLPSFF